MAVLRLAGALLTAFISLAAFVEGASVCPSLSKQNYGSDHCEVVSFVSREDDGDDMMTGTVWKNEGECNAKFFDVTKEDIAAVWPEAEVIKKNGPRMFMTNCSGMDSMAAVQARMSMPYRQLPKRVLAGTTYAAQAQLDLRRADAELWVAGAGTIASSGSLVNRSVVFAWEAGARVFELVSPEGWPYIMQSMSMQVDNDLTVEGLMTLGDRLTGLEEGWSYRSRVLETGIAVRGQDGMVAMVKQDQFQNSYSRHDTYNGLAWWDEEAGTTSEAPTAQAPAAATTDSETASTATAVLPPLSLSIAVFASTCGLVISL